MPATTVIRGGRVYDGTGAPWVQADIVISGDTIVDVTAPGKGAGDRCVDAAGLSVAPGFIDAHSHSDIPLIADGRAASKVHQGVTTELIGQCGSSAAPIDDEGKEGSAAWMARMNIDPDWATMEQYLARLERQGTAVNVAALVGHGNIRRMAVGGDDRPPTDEELQEMKRLLRQAMAEGAFGMSTGLIYPPGVFARSDELETLAAVLADYGGVYYTHMRDESDGLLDSIAETIALGRRAGVPVHISHLKAVGENNWEGPLARALCLMEEARQEGIDVTCDQYPYTASATGLSALLPHWAHDGGQRALLRRLADSETRTRLIDALEGVRCRNWDSVLISRVASDDRTRYEGMSMAGIAADMGLAPAEAVVRLLELEELQVGMVAFGMCEEDVRYALAHPLTMVGSDGSGMATDGVLAGGKPHPRNYGTFVRVLGKYAREEGVLSMAEAVRKMTSLPASRIGLSDRGLIRPGLRADLVAFDEATVRDAGTFADPARYARGIQHVIANGEFVIEDGCQTGVLPGRVLRRSCS